MMKRTVLSLMALMVLVCITIVPGESHAGTYFHWQPFSRVDVGGFFKIGTPVDNVQWGSSTGVIVHRPEDGFLLIPNLGWDLLDLGWTTPGAFNGLTFVIGPSLEAGEPVKAILRTLLDSAPMADQEGSYGALRALLAPAKAADGSISLSVGPGFALDTSNWRGAFVVKTALSKKF